MLNVEDILLKRNLTTAFLESFNSETKIEWSLYFPQNATSREIHDALKAVAAGPVFNTIEPHLKDMPGGIALFVADGGGCLCLPPFPLTRELVFEGLETGPLSEVLARDYSIALVLVRAGEFAVGVFRGETILDSRVGTGNVHARHKKGGSSQRRYERHRDKQLEYFLERVCGHARERFEPYQSELNYLAFGGGREVIATLSGSCSYLKSLNKPIFPVRLNPRNIRQASLFEQIKLIYSTRVITWCGDKLKGGV